MNRAMISKLAGGTVAVALVAATSTPSFAEDFRTNGTAHPPVEVARTWRDNGWHGGRDWHGYGWTGGYYRAPPVVYGGYGYGYGPYGGGYAYPPVLGLGINAGGVHVGLGL